MTLWQQARKRRAQRALARQLVYQQAKASAIAAYAETFIPAHEEYALGVRARIEQVRPIHAAAKLLEVGSGAHGLVFFLGQADAIGVDPLADEYRQLFPAWQVQAKTIAAYGEALPFPDASFDLVLSDNVIDHAEDPAKIAQEMCRVLRPGGLLYFTVHVHHPVYAWLDKVYALAQALGIGFEVSAFADHTVHFTPAGIRRLMAAQPLCLLSEATLFTPKDAGAPKGPRGWLQALFTRTFFKNASYRLIAERHSAESGAIVEGAGPQR